MPDENDLRGSNIEDRIAGEFMTRLHENGVDFEITDEMETLIVEGDLGDEEQIIERIEENVLNDGD